MMPLCRHWEADGTLLYCIWKHEEIHGTERQRRAGRAGETNIVFTDRWRGGVGDSTLGHRWVRWLCAVSLRTSIWGWMKRRCWTRSTKIRTDPVYGDYYLSLTHLPSYGHYITNSHRFPMNGKIKSTDMKVNWWVAHSKWWTQLY